MFKKICYVVDMFKRHNSQNYVRVLLKKDLFSKPGFNCTGFPLWTLSISEIRCDTDTSLCILKSEVCKVKTNLCSFSTTLGKTTLTITSLNLKDF